MPSPIACTGDLVDPKYGPPNVIASVTPTVLAHGRPVATIGAIVTPHGNYYNPKAPGFNPKCSLGKVLTGIPNVLVMGLPVAVIGKSLCDCGFHFVAMPGDPTVLVGP
jgi:uncharacterized Zn-binding protein involved in type VI secretion